MLVGLRYQPKHLSNKTLQEVEAGANTENFKMEEKPENKNRKINRFELPFPGFRKNLYEYWVEYSSYTSIQGIRYIGEPRRPVFERITWLLFFCVSLYMCIHLVIQTYHKWETSPVLVSFARTPTPVWKIPFPAITICPQIKTLREYYNYEANYYRMKDDSDNMTDAEVNMFANLGLVCQPRISKEPNLTTGYDAIAFLKKVAPTVTKWGCKNPFNPRCWKIFTPTLTKEGICYTFNMLDRSEIYRDNVFVYGDFMSHNERSGGWTLGEGYPKNVSIDTYPRRSLSAGIQSEFSITIYSSKEDLDYVCTGALQGYKIVLHHPAEVPQLGMHYYLAPHLQNVIFAIKPDMITTSDSLRNYDPQRRGCYFPEERYLAFFRSYTQQNCELECLTNFTLSKCKCVAFHMPHEFGTPICALGSAKCVLDAQQDLVRKEVQASINEEYLSVSGSSHCNCLQGCTSLVYNTEISQTDLNMEEYMNSFTSTMVEKIRNHQMTNFQIYFKEQQFITSERNELYSQTDFLANCGGLLGLFTGFSFLSLVEICYFLSLRLIGNVKKYGRQYWSGSQELVNNDKYDHQK